MLANGLGLAGAGAGTLALAPFVEFLQSQFHWRATVKILSALSVVLVVSGLLYCLVPSPTSHVMVTKETEKKRLDFSMLKNKAVSCVGDGCESGTVWGSTYLTFTW